MRPIRTQSGRRDRSGRSELRPAIARIVAPFREAVASSEKHATIMRGGQTFSDLKDDACPR